MTTVERWLAAIGMATIAAWVLDLPFESLRALGGLISFGPVLGYWLVPSQIGRTRTLRLLLALAVGYTVTVLVSLALMSVSAFDMFRVAPLLICIGLVNLWRKSHPIRRPPRRHSVRLIRSRIGQQREIGFEAMIVAFALWLHSAAFLDVSAIDDYGLISALPVTWFAAMAVIGISLCWQLRRDELDDLVLAGHLVVLILLLVGQTALAYELPRFPWTFKHVAVTEYVLREQSVDRYAGVYHSWPGFFVFTAAITEIAGSRSPIGFAQWTQVIFSVLNAAALRALFSVFSYNKRRVWIAVILFVLGNWVGQDYFAPQAIGFLMHLITLTAVLTLAGCAPGVKPVWGLFAQMSRVDRVPITPAVAATMAGTFGAVVMSHPLTPFMTLAAVGALWLIERMRGWWILVGLGLLNVAWLGSFALPTMVDFSGDLIASFGAIGTNVDDNVSAVASGSEGESMSKVGSRAVAAIMLALAGIGVVGQLHRRRIELGAIAVMVSPWPLIVGTEYGGEMLYRVYLFSLPWLAFAAAGAIAPTLENAEFSMGRVRIPALALSFAAVTALAPLAFFGDETVNRVTRAQFEATEHVFAEAPPDSLLIAATGWPLRNDPTFHDFQYLAPGTIGIRFDEEDRDAGIQSMIEEARSYQVPAYILAADSEARELRALGFVDGDPVADFVQALEANGGVDPVIGGPGITIYRVVGSDAVLDPVLDPVLDTAAVDVAVRGNDSAVTPR